MVDLAEAERFNAKMSTARVAGDVDALMRLFHAEPTFMIVGFGDELAGQGVLRRTLTDLVERFEFVEWQRVKTFVNGDDVAVRSRLKVRHRETGKVADTETSEFLTLKDGKCTAFVQFADTALIAGMENGAP